MVVMPSLPVDLVENRLCPAQCGDKCARSRRKISEAVGSEPYSEQIFDILECIDCGIGLTNPVPTEASSHLLYTTRESLDFQPEDAGLVSWLKAFAARRDVRGACHGIDLPENPNMLDFG